MLRWLFHTELSLGLAQAAVVAVTATLVAMLASRRGGPLRREIPLALLRGLVQILVIGFVLAILLRGPWWMAVPLLIGMVLMAANIVRSRARAIPETYTLSLICLVAGAGVVITLMTLLGIIAPEIKMLVPVGSMVIAQNM
ncbi:MAG TPA: ABC transporter permease, partial [Acidobacteriaceae bacterium]|nr:ABC transporter permease [Acidobacteriaceae bacterium]